MTLSDLIQVGAILVALLAAGASLYISYKDRKLSLKIARQTATMSRLAIELEYAVRLSANKNRGGSVDREESKRLGSEALALASVVGQRWVPRQYERAMSGKTRDEMEYELTVTESEYPQWVRDKMETALAIQAILDEMYGVSGGDPQ